ncbi:ribonuclease MRP protein subunit POP4 [Impatiens glandulifera]|uniref:ribonuclease MRP protein subunit POP4 n=1 Tax=Impatiens glandulifera TaxID=253017 RepID=UPI001FB19618|nr:ribonuclease MRP protein subunit POP4 [Impatiens glandulifera]
MSKANNEDQRKRALDAISRRSLALEEAEDRQQQQQQKKTKRADEGNKIHSSVDSSTEKTKPFPNISSKKGNIAFSGHYAMQDAELGGSTYLQLSHSVHENLLNASTKTSGERGGGTIVSDILHDLFQKGDSAHKYMHGSKSMKIDSYILLDNVVHGGGKRSLTAPIRQLKNRSKLSKKIITSIKQHKKCGTHDLPPELHKYDIFKPMHEMWMGYMMQLLKNVGKNQLPQCLLTADLHGAILLVVQCKITPFIGVSGIMIRETAETFGIITEENNKFRVVPKKHSVFVLQLDCWKITLVGDQLTSRTI